MNDDLTPDGRYEAPLSSSLLKRLVALQEQTIQEQAHLLKVYRAAAMNFIAKVDAGKARSVVSYAEFTAALAEHDKL